MPGPVPAARPLMRTPSALLFRQLTGPSPRVRPLPSLPGSRSPYAQPSVCRVCRLHERIRLIRPIRPVRPYSTESGPTDPSQLSHPASSKLSSSPRAPKEPAEACASSKPPPNPSPTRSSSHTAELPSQADSRRSAFSQNFGTFMDNLQSRVLVASQTINDLTGYSAIEAIKAHNQQLEADLAAAQSALKQARTHYKAVNARRASTQREVTTLLARKDSWAPSDLERFTTLYRQDHELEAAVADASAALTDAEAEESRLSQALNSGMLRRYHEEQIWSDRIRRQSTWGTWGLMGVNVLLFLVLQFIAEPWKRHRLMKGIAAEEKAALEAVTRELAEVKDTLARTEPEPKPEPEPKAVLNVEVQDGGAGAVMPTDVAESVSDVPPDRSWKETLRDPGRWGPVLQDLYSERRINLRMRDASLLALEGAVTGAAVVVSISMVLLRNR